MTKPHEKECKCLSLRFREADFDSTFVGTDSQECRYGEVSVHRCTGCGRVWLHYHVEYESFTGSGRCFRGLISESDLAALKPENAIQILESLDWHFIGGSFFGGSPAKRSRQKLETGPYS